MAGLSEQELTEIERHMDALADDVPGLLAEVRRLRAIESAAVRVNDAWYGFDENEKFKAWRALNVALHEWRDTGKPEATGHESCINCGHMRHADYACLGCFCPTSK